MSLHIFKGNSKLRGLFHKYRIWGINLPALITCRKNAPCAKICYACHGMFTLKNVKLAHNENLEMYLREPEEFELQIMRAAKKRGHWRWHSSGDIVDGAYLAMMCRIAVSCPDTKFLCFTKKYELVNEYLDNNELPENLTIVFSQWGIFTPYNPHNLPIAAVKFKNGESNIPANARRCPGYCGDCVFSNGNCWDMKCGESVYFDEH